VRFHCSKKRWKWTPYSRLAIKGQTCHLVNSGVKYWPFYAICLYSYSVSSDPKQPWLCSFTHCQLVGWLSLCSHLYSIHIGTLAYSFLYLIGLSTSLMCINTTLYYIYNTGSHTFKTCRPRTYCTIVCVFRDIRLCFILLFLACCVMLNACCDVMWICSNLGVVFVLCAEPAHRHECYVTSPLLLYVNVRTIVSPAHIQFRGHVQCIHVSCLHVSCNVFKVPTLLHSCWIVYWNGFNSHAVTPCSPIVHHISFLCNMLP